jgi:hypothetical protein
MMTFGNCSEEEFISLCDRSKLCAADRVFWIDLFKRAVHAAGRRKLPPQDQAKLIAFITAGRRAAAR